MIATLHSIVHAYIAYIILCFDLKFLLGSKVQIIEGLDNQGSDNRG